jgi:predicted metal-binding membrane protein
MMTAMMLPSVSPFVRTYQATVTTHRAPRLVALGAGYVAVWTAVGLATYVVADWFGRLAADRPAAAHATAVATFAVIGIYQLTPPPSSAASATAVHRSGT